MTSPAHRLTVKPIGGSSVFEAGMPFRARKKPEPLDEAALYQYAVGALARQMRTVAELKRLMIRRVESGDPGDGDEATDCCTAESVHGRSSSQRADRRLTFG